MHVLFPLIHYWPQNVANQGTTHTIPTKVPYFLDKYYILFHTLGNI